MNYFVLNLHNLPRVTLYKIPHSEVNLASYLKFYNKLCWSFMKIFLIILYILLFLELNTFISKVFLLLKISYYFLMIYCKVLKKLMESTVEK